MRIPFPSPYALAAALAGLVLLSGCSADRADATDRADLVVDASVAAEPPARARLTDFADPAHRDRWFLVLDNVMGGRSTGRVSFRGDADPAFMTFAGDINTNGGGFASLRLPIPPGALADARAIRLRVRADGRGPYRAFVIDDLDTRPRRVLHRHDLPLDPALAGDPVGTWQTVSIDLDALTPTFHGDPVAAAPLDPARAVELGLILNDTTDGPFRLDVTWIEAVR